jgi:hypothetical protein
MELLVGKRRFVQGYGKSRKHNTRIGVRIFAGKQIVTGIARLPISARNYK